MAGKDRHDGSGSNGPVVERRGRGAPSATDPVIASARAQADEPPGTGQAPPPGGPWTPPSPGPSTGSERRAHLEHDGRFGEIFVLFLINLLLTVVTLGIYRFWGKTRIRKYVWSHASLHGERLEYTGTGMELFLGFLFALVILGGPILGFYLWLLANPPRDQEALARIVLLAYPVLIVGVFFIYYVAIFAAYRYRVSRTAWFGIRGGMQGSAWTYGLVALGLGALNILSFGWTKPWADSVVFRYRLSRTWFGSERFTSGMRVAGMYSRFALAWIGTALVLTAGIAVTITFMPASPTPTGQVDRSAMAAANLAIIVTYVATIVVWNLLVPWYRAALVRNIANTLSAGGVRFETLISGGQMFALAIPNFLLLIVTLGFAYPSVVLRTARYVARHLVFIGDIETARVRQTEVSAPWYGEGIMEFLGVGMI
jgi:uncharacterized membrane protein YjgN (DUF898 family)